MNTEIHQLEVDSIKPFISRARPKEGFERMKESIREIGLRIPIQVRAQRSGKFRYELIVGEGRLLAHKELNLEKIPAYVLDVPEGEIVGRFLAENVMRKKLPWQDKARLIADESRDMTPKQIAKRYFITEPHAAKLQKIWDQASPKVKADLDKLTVEEAAILTSLPAQGQDIIVETLQEAQLEQSQIAAIVRKAKELTQTAGDLSKTALKQSLKRIGEDLARIRDRLKLARLHTSLGPENLRALLSDKKFRAALDRHKINYSKFEPI